MSALVLKNIPLDLHERLRKEATTHRHSMTQEAIHLLEEGLRLNRSAFPEPIKGARPLTQKFLDKAIRDDRS